MHQVWRVAMAVVFVAVASASTSVFVVFAVIVPFIVSSVISIAVWFASRLLRRKHMRRVTSLVEPYSARASRSWRGYTICVSMLARCLVNFIVLSHHKKQVPSGVKTYPQRYQQETHWAHSHCLGLALFGPPALDSQAHQVDSVHHQQKYRSDTARLD